MPDTTGRGAPRRARRAFVCAGLLALAAAAGCRGRDLAPTPESRWIAARAVPLRGIDPAEASLDDLEPLLTAGEPEKTALLARTVADSLRLDLLLPGTPLPKAAERA